MREVLANNRTIGLAFRATGVDLAVVVAGLPAGASARLELQLPGGAWLALDGDELGGGVRFTSDGMVAGIITARGEWYRIVATAAGGRAYVTEDGVSDVAAS